MGAFSQPPSLQHWLGTDQIGRDQLSRLLSGTRVSLLVGVLAAAISTCVGVILGLISGFFGGVVDMVIMRLTDAIMSFPYILLVLVAASIFEPGLWSIILILGLVDWPGVARLVRGNTLSLRESNFIKSSQLSGMSRRYLLFSDILPNTIAPVLVYATSVVAISMLDEAALSFLGMGVQPPVSSLGSMLNGAESLTILTSKPWLWVPPRRGHYPAGGGHQLHRRRPSGRARTPPPSEAQSHSVRQQPRFRISFKFGPGLDIASPLC